MKKKKIVHFKKEEAKAKRGRKGINLIRISKIMNQLFNKGFKKPLYPH